MVSVTSKLDCFDLGMPRMTKNLSGLGNSCQTKRKRPRVAVFAVVSGRKWALARRHIRIIRHKNISEVNLCVPRLTSGIS